MKRQIFRTGPWRLCERHCRQLRAPTLVMVALTALVAGGCAHVVPRSTSKHSTPSPAATTSAAARGASAASRLSAIVNGELQRGHYAQGAKALRRYMAKHPDDQPAQFMLHQLTADPVQMLGQASRPYVVQAGDTFSGLAARYLGDPNLFLILARYNGSTNPSELNVGQTIRLPTSAPGMSTPAAVAVPGQSGADQRASASVPSKDSPTPAPTIETAGAKAARLQAQSVALLDHGHKAQALAHLDKALDMDPQLRPSGTKSVALRKQLLANYHQRAVILYRDQHLNQAIALWNHVLAIDPGYEPAVIYRARALELKRRLKQFKQH